MRLRLVGWLASVTMHLVVVFVLVFVVEAFKPVVFSYDQVYEVDIVAAPREAAAAKPLSPLKKAEPEPRPEPPPKPAEVQAKAPEPARTAPPPPETSPPPQSAQAGAEPVPAKASSLPAVAPVPKGTARIPSRYGVVKVPREEWNKRLAQWSDGVPEQQNATGRQSGIETAEESKAFAERLQKMRVIQRRIRGEDGEEENYTRVVGTHGFATFSDTFSLDQIAYGEYTPDEFAGHYKAHGGGYLSIIDARESYDGKLILHEHQSGMTRTLGLERARIYSYGPAFGEQKPMKGSITFLPKKPEMEHVKAYLTGHLFWLPETPPMRWCKMQLFEPRDTAVSIVGGGLDAFVLPPPGGISVRAGVVLAAGESCMSRSAAMAVAQTLALKGLVVLGYAPRGCAWPGGGGEAAGERFARAGDLLAAAKVLSGEPELAGLPVGLYGIDQGVLDALTAAGVDPRVPFVAACLAKEEGAPPPRPPMDLLRKVRVPVLFILSGGEAGEWRPFTQILENARPARTLAALPQASNAAVRQALYRYHLSQSKRFAMHLDALLSGELH